ncbi:esterase [Altererythrobacter sp. B11]|uniref:alpha/beta hydrolase n=1 Tax=Altererythrobacter sp. B11 TaxID=2060312 RepID=UPI000DC74234|nr:alpha/beta fold hydrolase [Altererythrobacter sp. B11]BBC71017.1 esterase [Altererythrobacter sp. B11]
MQNIVAAALALLALLPLPAFAAPSSQVSATDPSDSALNVRIERRIVHSPAVAGNLLNTSADREVYIALPPSYDAQPKRRYPVVYALHGFSTDARRWMEKLQTQAGLGRAFASGAAELIVVFPDASNQYGGSFYGRSVVTGDFETFVADELPAFIDENYRTIARPAARGLMGHSMGGYGVARIAMMRPGRFGALYMMSPCCLAPLGVQGLTQEEVHYIHALKSPEQAVGLPFKYAGPLATAAAFSPNPAKPPLFVDLPVTDAGDLRQDVMAKRDANAPLAFLDQYVAALRTYRAIGIDVGDADSIVPAATELHESLDRYVISNTFEVYSGDHTNRVAERFGAVVIPFLARSLAE